MLCLLLVFLMLFVCQKSHHVEFVFQVRMDDIPALLTEYKQLCHPQIALDQAAWLSSVCKLSSKLYNQALMISQIEILQKLQQRSPKVLVLGSRLMCSLCGINIFTHIMGRLFSTTDEIPFKLTVLEIFVSNQRTSPARKHWRQPIEWVHALITWHCSLHFVLCEKCC